MVFKIKHFRILRMSSNGKTTTIVNVADGVSKKIKAIVLTSTGSGSDYSNLQIKEEDYPHLERDDQVIVRIKASGLNFAELMQRQGLYRPSTKTPYTPGYEGSGVVEILGSGVTDLKVNDRVLVFNSSGIWKDVINSEIIGTQNFESKNFFLKRLSYCHAQMY